MLNNSSLARRQPGLFGFLCPNPWAVTIADAAAESPVESAARISQREIDSSRNANLKKVARTMKWTIP